MAEIIKVDDVMSKNVITVGLEDNIGTAARMFEEYKFSGIPVVDGEKKLVGLLTSYDMVLQTRIHLPNILGVIGGLSAKEINMKLVEMHLHKIQHVKVKNIMNPDPLVVSQDVKVGDLVGEFAEHHRVNPIPVIDHTKVLIGIVSRLDVIRFFSERYLLQVAEASGHHGVLQRLTRIGEEKSGDQ